MTKFLTTVLAFEPIFTLSKSFSMKPMAKLLSILDETIVGLRIIKSFNAEWFVNSKFHKLNARYAKLLRSIAYKKHLASPTSQFLGVCRYHAD
ncbi:MAG: ABC transporter transmembrane domain-containing protein, partial [Pseudomonadota bacterium]